MVYKASHNILQISNILDFGVCGDEPPVWQAGVGKVDEADSGKRSGPKKNAAAFQPFWVNGWNILRPSGRAAKTGIMTPEMAKSFEQLKAASDEKFEGAIDFCLSSKISVVALAEDGYPKRLLEISSPPCTLFLWGDTSLLDAQKTFSIVGAREANDAGREFAYDTARQLAGAGFTIVSGGAKGIDTMAHRGALDAMGKTIAVMGTGFSNFYPEENRALFEEIRKKGLLVSEHLPNFHGDRISFLQRNRITSGLSDALLFCASERLGSGTATQLKIAHAQKKRIFCPAMDMGIAPNIGIQDAIVEYKAKPVRNAGEIIGALGSMKMAQYASLQGC